jgi:hypothetical protein
VQYATSDPLRRRHLLSAVPCWPRFVHSPPPTDTAYRLPTYHRREV